MTAFRFKTEEELNSFSAEIPWVEAEPLIADYARRPDAIKVELPDGVVTTLKALRFSVENIRQLIDRGGVTDLYLMFATSPVNASNITIIAGGVNDELGDGGFLLTDLLYDYCEPCPNKCAML